MSMDDDEGRVIEVIGLAKSFDGRTVVRGVSLTAHSGDLIALVGANGGGKTTTLRMLAGLLKPDAGSGHILGCDVLNPAAAHRSKIGYMTQRHALYPELSVAENLQFRANIHGLGADSLNEAISNYQLRPHLNKRFDQLSGGWARRVQLAATMLNAPELLLLDEPTAGLDAVSRREIWNILESLALHGHTIVVSTHDLAEAARSTALIDYHEGSARGSMTPNQMMAHSNAVSLDEAILALAGGR